MADGILQHLRCPHGKLFCGWVGRDACVTHDLSKPSLAFINYFFLEVVKKNIFSPLVLLPIELSLTELTLPALLWALSTQ